MVRSMERIERNKISGNGIGAGAGNPPAASVPAPGISPAFRIGAGVPGRVEVSASGAIPVAPAAMFTPATPGVSAATPTASTPAMAAPGAIPPGAGNSPAPPAPRRSYRVLDEAGCAAAFARLRDGGLLWAFDCEWEEPSLERWMRVCSRPDVLLLEGLVDGVAAGLMKIAPFQERTLCGEVGVAAYRGFFAPAAWLARGACLWCFAHLDCVSLLGRVAVPNRHALRMAPQVGFRELCRVPGMCWYGRKQRFVDGALLLATPESVQACEV